MRILQCSGTSMDKKAFPSCREFTEEQSWHSVCTKKKDPPKVNESPDDAAGPKKSKIKYNCYLKNTDNHLYWDGVRLRHVQFNLKPFEIRYTTRGAPGTSIVGGGVVVGGHRLYQMFERVTVVSYRLSIMTISPSLAIWPQFAIECLRRSNEQGWVTLD